MATLSFEKPKFIFRGSKEERLPPKNAGFLFDPDNWVDPNWNTIYMGKVKQMIENCREVDVALIINDSAKKEIRKGEEDEKVKLEMSRSTGADMIIPAPNGLEYYSFQKAGIQYTLKIPNTLIADEMGLGKTIQAIGVINCEKPKKVLIICPASLKLNWKKELEKWLVDEYSIAIANGEEDFEKNITIINYDRLRKYMKQYLSLVTKTELMVENKKTQIFVCDVCGGQFRFANLAFNHIDKKHEDEIKDILMKTKYDILILDESHYIKNFKAQRTQAVVRIAKRAKRRMFLTGTPILNRPIELFTPLCILDSELIKGGWVKYVTRYCGGKRGHFGWDVSGASNLDELNTKLRTSVMVRRLKKDVLSELPSKIRSIIPIEAKDKDIKEALKEEAIHRDKWLMVKAQLEKASVNSEENKEEFEQQVTGLKRNIALEFAEISRIRHQTALAKLPEAIDFIKNVLEIQDKIIVYTHHKDVLDGIYQEFKDVSVVLTGDVSLDDRDKAVESFQNDDKVKLFLGTIQAAGLGITLTASSIVIFVELEWTPSEMSQAEDRAHRIGQKNIVNIYHLIIDGSIDSELSNVLIEKQKVIDAALDEIVAIEMADLSDIEGPAQKEASKALEKLAEKLSDEDGECVHNLLAWLSSRCDGAMAEDGMGFNKIDSKLGKSLAAAPRLSKKQVALGYVILIKYRRQIEHLGDCKNLYNKEKK